MQVKKKRLGKEKSACPEERIQDLRHKSGTPSKRGKYELVSAEAYNWDALVDKGENVMECLRLNTKDVYEGYILAKAMVSFFERIRSLRLAGEKSETVVRALADRIFPGKSLLRELAPPATDMAASVVMQDPNQRQRKGKGGDENVMFR